MRHSSLYDAGYTRRRAARLERCAVPNSKPAIRIRDGRTQRRTTTAADGIVMGDSTIWVDANDRERRTGDFPSEEESYCKPPPR